MVAGSGNSGFCPSDWPPIMSSIPKGTFITAEPLLEEYGVNNNIAGGGTKNSLGTTKHQDIIPTYAIPLTSTGAGNDISSTVSRAGGGRQPPLGGGNSTSSSHYHMDDGVVHNSTEANNLQTYYLPPTPPYIKKQRYDSEASKKAHETEKREMRLERRRWQREKESLLSKIETLEDILERSKIPKPVNFEEGKDPGKYYHAAQKFRGGPHSVEKGATTESSSPPKWRPQQRHKLPDLKNLEPSPVRFDPEKAMEKAERAELQLQSGDERGTALKIAGRNFIYRQEFKAINWKRMNAYGGTLWDTFRDWQKNMQNPVYKPMSKSTGCLPPYNPG